MPTTEAEPIRVVVAIILRDGEVCLTRRADHLHAGGLWEFPGGKIEPGESDQNALGRELREELGINVQGAEFLQQIDWDYPEKRVSLRVYLVSQFIGEPQGLEGQPLQWVRIKDLGNYDFPAANQSLVTLIQSR